MNTGCSNSSFERPFVNLCCLLIITAYFQKCSSIEGNDEFSPVGKFQHHNLKHGGTNLSGVIRDDGGASSCMRQVLSTAGRSISEEHHEIHGLAAGRKQLGALGKEVRDVLTDLSYGFPFRCADIVTEICVYANLVELLIVDSEIISTHKKTSLHFHQHCFSFLMVHKKQ